MQARKAAASVWMQQNAVQQESNAPLAEARDEAEYDAFTNIDRPAPLPGGMAGMSYGGGGTFSKRERAIPELTLKTSEELQLEKEPIRVRETGFWLWKRVIVPPNAYVVHTRMGRTEPVTIGLGQSFRMNPETDAYLVVPAAMQTIGIVANCITQEKQGINILAYVQWQINNFSTAYRKLDFSDSRDPLGIVNAQLREQAEAAIKDKIATMSVEEVLTDKEPVIEELTNRLRTVAEGRSQQTDTETDKGLGIKIVTVQIKEALVSSQRLWENLQAPFRYEKEMLARISYLQSQDEIRQKELETRRISETSEAETLVAIERIKQGKQTEAAEVRLNEENTRFTKEQETTRQRLELAEQTTIIRRESEERLLAAAAAAQQEMKLANLRREQESELEAVRLDAEANARRKALQVDQTIRELTEQNRLAEVQLQNQQVQIERDTTLKQLEAAFNLLLQEQTDALKNRVTEAFLARKQRRNSIALTIHEAEERLRLALSEREVEISRQQQEADNLINERAIAGRLVEKLPELAEHMPEIHDYKVIQTGTGAAGDTAFEPLLGFLTKLVAVGQGLGLPSLTEKDKPEGEKSS